MPLKTVEMASREGRVCYVTEEKGVRHVTVECALEKRAYRFPWNGGSPVLVGDWVEFEGEMRLELLSRSGEPDLFRDIPYYHDPYDGSPKGGWRYFDVRSPVARRIGPMEALDPLREALAAAAAHVGDWYGNDGAERIRRTLEALEAAQDAMRTVLARRASLDGEAAAKALFVSLEV